MNYLEMRGAVEVLRSAARYLCAVPPTDIQAVILLNEKRFALLLEYRAAVGK